MAVTMLCCLVGGGTYPALAVLFSKTMRAFETIDVSKGNFFSLMFFVVALANFVAYFIAGWLANILAQVSEPLSPLPPPFFFWRHWR